MELLLETELSGGYRKQLSSLKEHVKKKIPEIAQKFPNYTLHDMNHFTQVAKNVDMLCRPLRINDSDRFCLLSASYCHDLGMAHSQINQEFYWMKKAEIRKWHAKFSGDTIRNEIPKNCINEEGLREAIALICEGHGRWDWDHMDFDPYAGINIRLFSLLLSLADALDIRSERRNPKDIKSIQELMKNPFLDEISSHDPKIDSHPELKHLSRIHWLRHYYAVEPSIQFVEKSKVINIRLRAKVGVMKNEKGRPIQNNRGKFIHDLRQPIIEEIIQSDLLLLMNNPLSKRIISKHIDLKLGEPLSVWNSYVNSGPVLTKMLFPAELVKTAFTGGLIREQEIRLKSYDEYYKIRIEPFISPDDFQVSCTQRPASLAPKYAMKKYPKSHVTHINIIKNLASKCWDFVFWAVKPYIKFISDLLKQNNFKEARARLELMLFTPNLIRKGKLKRYFLPDTAVCAPDPITVTAHIGKFGFYKGAPTMDNLQGGAIHIGTDRQKARFRVLCKQIVEILGFEPSDEECSARLKEACNIQDAYKLSLGTFKKIFEGIKKETTKISIPQEFNIFLSKGLAILNTKLISETTWKHKENPRLELMEKEDIDTILRIEELSFSHPWERNGSYSKYTELLDAFTLYKGEGEIAGYLLIREKDDALWIHKMAVRPDFCRKRLGSFLVRWTKELATQQNLSKILLHVRESNESAVVFYEKLGFKIVEKMKDYYKKGTKTKEKTALKMAWSR